MFQPLLSDCSVQTDRDVRDVSTQTSAAEVSHHSISSKPAAECSDYKPKKMNGICIIVADQYHMHAHVELFVVMKVILVVSRGYVVHLKVTIILIA